MSKNCIIFEDNEMTREILKIAMGIYEYNVIGEYSSFNEYLLDPKDNIDLIITNIHLEGNTNGFELIKIFQRVINPKVIYTSADIDKEILKKCKETKPVTFLKKPIDMEQLRCVLGVME